MLVREVMRILTPLFSAKADQSGHGPLTCWVFFTPASRLEETADWLHYEASLAGWEPDQVILKPQAGGNLGNRLRIAFEQGFQAGYGRVAAIGTDCVELDCGLVRQSFDQLPGDYDLVFGPASDGGYYLVAMNRPEVCAVFENIPWSSGSTLAASLAVAEQSGFRVHLLGELSDVDTVADWQRVKVMLDEDG